MQILISFLAVKQRLVIPLELLRQEHSLGKALRIAACYIRADGSPEWLLSVSVSLSGWSLCRWDPVLCSDSVRFESSSVLGGMSLLSWLSPCWMLLLETRARAAHTEGPQAPNTAFSFHPGTAELTDWCTNLVCRCLCCLRRAFHPQ